MAKRFKHRNRSAEAGRGITDASGGVSSIHWVDAQWRIPLQALVIIAAGLWVYWPVLHGGWLWEDDFYITGNRLLNDPTRLWKAWFEPGSFIEYYPIEQTLQWLQWQLWHTDTLGYHVTNLVLHLTSALLVWRLFSKFGLRLAWLGGMIFAVHPVMVESVAWITEFKNTLSLPPFLLAMCFYLDYEDRGRRGDYLLALGFFLVAMLCKPTMVMFPLVILLYAWWKRGRIRQSDWKISAPFFVIALALGLLAIWSGLWFAQRHHLPRDIVPLGGFFSHMAMTGLAISFYFLKAVWPVGLMPIYPQWQVNPPSLLQFLPWPMLGVAIYALWTQRHGWARHVFFGLGFFLIMLAPFVTNIVGGYTTFTWVMDHFLYIPILGLIGLVVAGLGEIEQRLSPPLRQGGVGIVALVVIVLAGGSHAYAKKFINQEALWTYALKRNPEAWLAHNNLGTTLISEGRIDEAIAQFRAALQINPSYIQANYNLGNALAQNGQADDAIAQFQKALQMNPDDAETHYNFGVALSQKGRGDEAMAQFQKALAIDPNSAEAHSNLGIAYFQKGDVDEAMAHFQKALEINPNSADTRNNLGTTLIQKGRLDEAISQFQMVLDINPNSAQARYNLGCALFQKKRFDEAMAQFQKALEINPNDANAHYYLGASFVQKGQTEQAISQFREVLRLNPANIDAQNSLTQALAVARRAHDAK